MLQNMKSFMTKWKQQKGLTLVELLAVIVILGIIAGIAVPSVNGIINNSKEDAHEANIDMIEAAGKLAKISGLNPGEDGYTVTELQTEGYLESVPLSPWDGTTRYNGSINDTGVYVPGNDDVEKP
jgi:type IV pilus assembly protein PilA